MSQKRGDAFKDSSNEYCITLCHAITLGHMDKVNSVARNMMNLESPSLYVASPLFSCSDS